MIGRLHTEGVFSRNLPGLEPLFYAPLEGGAVLEHTYGELFASGLVKKNWRREALVDFLGAGAVAFGEGETFFEGVFEVPPGHRLEIRDGRCGVVREEPFPEPREELGEEGVALLREVLLDQVDVPDDSAGLCLSGGLDSSNLGAALARKGSPRCFIYGKPGSPDRELALEAARALGAEPFLLEPQSRASLEELEEMLRILEIPVHIPGGPLPQFRLLDAMAGEGISRVYSGQGGDEVFCGYPWHFPLAMKKLALRDAERAENYEALHQEHPPFGVLELRLARRNFTRTASWVTLNDGRACEALGISREEMASRRGVGYFAPDMDSWEALRRQELESRSLRYLLHYDHRLNRHFGLEGQAPFLSPRVMGVISRFRLETLYRDGLLKYPLRVLFPEIPERVRFFTKKSGFWHNGPELPDLLPRVTELLETTDLGELVPHPGMLLKMNYPALWRFFALGVLLEKAG